VGIFDVLSIILAILKPVMEAFFNALAEKLTEPDITRIPPDPTPVLHSLDVDDDSIDLDRFSGLLEGA